MVGDMDMLRHTSLIHPARRRHKRTRTRVRDKVPLRPRTTIRDLGKCTMGLRLRTATLTTTRSPTRLRMDMDPIITLRTGIRTGRLHPSPRPMVTDTASIHPEEVPPE